MYTVRVCFLCDFDKNDYFYEYKPGILIIGNLV